MRRPQASITQSLVHGNDSQVLASALAPASASAPPPPSYAESKHHGSNNSTAVSDSQKLAIMINVLHRKPIQALLAVALVLWVTVSEYRLISADNGQVVLVVGVPGSSGGTVDSAAGAAATLGSATRLVKQIHHLQTWLLLWMFSGTIVGTWLLAGVVRDWLFGDACSSVGVEHPSSRSFTRNLTAALAAMHFLALTLVTLILGGTDVMPVSTNSLTSRLLSVAATVLYASMTMRDIGDAKEIRALADPVNFEAAVGDSSSATATRCLQLTYRVLHRSDMQFCVSVVFFVWFLGQNVFTYVLSTTSNPLASSNMLLLFAFGIFCTTLISSSLRDYIFAATCRAYVPHRTDLHRNQNGRYLILGAAAFVVIVSAYYTMIRPHLPWDDTLTPLVTQALAALIVITPYRDRVDADLVQSL